MITLSHAVYNLAILGKHRDDPPSLPILLGAIAPDLATTAFFLYHKLILHIPSRELWSTYYDRSSWDVVACWLHSIPLATLVLALLWWKRSRWGAFFAGSWLLHIVLDFFLHHTDAHAQLLPFSQWMFRSPISYWETAYYGKYVGTIELVGTLVLLYVLWRRYSSFFARLAVIFSGVVALTILIGNIVGGPFCPGFLENLACWH